jgi:colanic acid/amylovoran biosynthesis glycosyltransferase
MGYVQPEFSPGTLREAEAFWDDRGVTGQPGSFVACFVGTIGRQFDLDVALDAARILAGRGRNHIRFVLCGAGDRLEYYRRRASDVSSVCFPGLIDAAQIHVLLRRASVGLDPLQERFDFLATVNNKAIEYLSAGLPVISSPLRGVLFELLQAAGCGASYPSGDAHALAAVLERLSDGPDELRRMATRAHATFTERFRAEVVYSDFLDHLRGIVDQGAARVHRQRAID